MALPIRTSIVFVSADGRIWGNNVVERKLWSIIDITLIVYVGLDPLFSHLIPIGLFCGSTEDISFWSSIADQGVKWGKTNNSI